MPTTAGELQSSDVTRITGEDEAHAVDVFLHEDGKRRMAVDIPTTANRLNRKYRVDLNPAATAISAGAAFTQIYSHTGAGILHGFHIDTSSDKTQVRLVIDGEQVLDGTWTIKDVADLSLKASGAPPVLLQNRSGLTTEGGSDIDFSPHSDIAFNTGVQILVRKSDNTALTVNRSVVYISKF